MTFAIPVTSQERNLAAKFQLDWPSGLDGEVKIGDGRTEHDDNTFSGIPIPDKLIRPRSHLPRRPWGLQNLRPLAIIGRPQYFHGHTM